LTGSRLNTLWKHGDTKMGVNYSQYCYLGLAFDLDEIHFIESPAEYKLEDRYDVKTGKVTHQEKVLVKEEVSYYKINGANFEDPDDFNIKNFETISNNDRIYVGYSIGNFRDYGRVDLLEGSISLDELIKMSNEIKNAFPDYKDKVMIHFFNSVG
jgi:hypothetical protein